MARFAQTAHGLDPTEYFLNAFAHAEAGRIAGMARRAVIELPIDDRELIA
jgi:hypothetical protein